MKSTVYHFDKNVQMLFFLSATTDAATAARSVAATTAAATATTAATAAATGSDWFECSQKQIRTKVPARKAAGEQRKTLMEPKMSQFKYTIRLLAVVATIRL